MCVCVCVCVCLQSLSRAQLFGTPWGTNPWGTVAPQAPLSIDSLGKNTGVSCHSLLQGIFPTWGLNPGLLHCRQILYHLSYPGRPILLLQLLRCFSRVLPCATLWTAAHQAPLSTGFSRQEYWSELPFPSPRPILMQCKFIFDHICKDPPPK